MLRVETVNGTSVIRVPYYQDNDIETIKVNILIVSQHIGNETANFYSAYAQDGSFSYSTIVAYSKHFSTNFGINSSLYGLPPTNSTHCILGLRYLFLNCTIGHNSQHNSFLFHYNGSETISISYSAAEILRADVVCYGISC